MPPVDLAIDGGARINGTEIGPGCLSKGQMEDTALHLTAREPGPHAHGATVADAGKANKVAVVCAIRKI